MDDANNITVLDLPNVAVFDCKQHKILMVGT